MGFGAWDYAYEETVAQLIFMWLGKTFNFLILVIVNYQRLAMVNILPFEVKFNQTTVKYDCRVDESIMVIVTLVI